MIEGNPIPGREYLLAGHNGRKTPVQVKAVRKIYDAESYTTLGEYWSFRTDRGERVAGYVSSLSEVPQPALFRVAAGHE